MKGERHLDFDFSFEVLGRRWVQEAAGRFGARCESEIVDVKGLGDESRVDGRVAIMEVLLRPLVGEVVRVVDVGESGREAESL